MSSLNSKSAAPLVRICALAGLAALVSSCALFGFGRGDIVSGRYEGSWYVGESTEPAGGLAATITLGENGDWVAKFEAEFGGSATYNVELNGRSVGDKVAFGGDEDLGDASGGVFNWVGEADGELFKGEYTSRLVNGTFQMRKVEE